MSGRVASHWSNVGVGGPKTKAAVTESQSSLIYGMLGMQLPSGSK